MSEAKNTALGVRAGFRYSQVTSPAAPPAQLFQPTPAMITTTLVLAALVLLTSWDSSDDNSRQPLPVVSDPPDRR